MLAILLKHEIAHKLTALEGAIYDELAAGETAKNTASKLSTSVTKVYKVRTIAGLGKLPGHQISVAKAYELEAAYLNRTTDNERKLRQELGMWPEYVKRMIVDLEAFRGDQKKRKVRDTLTSRMFKQIAQICEKHGHELHKCEFAFSVKEGASASNQVEFSLMGNPKDVMMQLGILANRDKSHLYVMIVTSGKQVRVRCYFEPL